ncbi:hypothetical protein F2Q70_00022650 [Brassica cretica]|uniref:Secreted protein n=1 Tax=Brassica cretica TaxID=69181 RepID=A0A8S9GPU7_BRACR|nr:hypothetical protein F2Q70_00022650 [Brassica cretica]KAF3610415.1 hypothetical protein DY000_02049320 [Brassica cretica]
MQSPLTKDGGKSKSLYCLLISAFLRCITVFQIEAACVTTKGKGGSGTVYGERTIKGLMKLTSSQDRNQLFQHGYWDSRAFCSSTVSYKD